MYLDTSDMSGAGERAHRRLCDFIWFSDVPPPNRSKSLQQITHTDVTDWGDVKRELIGKGWVESNEYFLHRGAIKSLNASKVKYVENFNRQAKMNKADPLKLSSPDAVTGIVTIIVTLPVTPTVTTTQSESELESESVNKNSLPQKHSASGGSGGADSTVKQGARIQEQGDGPAENSDATSRFPEIPTVEQAIAMTMNAGIPEDYTRYVYDKWAVRAGRDGGGVIVPFLRYIVSRWKGESVEWMAGTHTGQRNNKTHGRTGKKADHAKGF